MRNNEIRTKRIKKYGVCLNDKCDNYKQIQEILHGDMECPICKKKLSPCAPPKKKGMNKGLLAAIIAAVIAIIVACIFIFAGGNEEPKVQPDTTAIDTSAVNKPIQEIVEEDSVSKDSTEAKEATENTATEERSVKIVEKTVVVEKPVVVEKIVEKKAENSSSPVTKETAAPGPKVSFGSYSGPANGMGGEISVTRAYSLDLRKGDGSSLDLQPGDKIRNTRFQNGELKQGVWVHNGEAQFFSR